MRRLIITMAAIAILFASLGLAETPSDPGRPKFVEPEVKTDIDSVRRDLDEVKSDVAKLHDKVRQIEAKIQLIESRLDAIESRLGIPRKAASPTKTTDRADAGKCRIRVVNMQSVRVAVTVAGVTRTLLPSDTVTFRDIECGSVTYEVRSPRYRETLQKTITLTSGQSATVRIEPDTE